MVIAELNVERVAVFEAEADAPLVVHGNGVLSGSVAFEGVQAIAGRHFEIGDLGGGVYGFELTQSTASDVGGDALRLSGAEQLLGLPISEGLDHAKM